MAALLAAPGLSVPMEVEVSAPPGELAESLSIVTEREEIVLPVTASVLSADEFDSLGHPLCAVGVGHVPDYAEHLVVAVQNAP